MYIGNKVRVYKFFAPKVSLYMGKMVAVYGSDGSSGSYKDFWAKMIPKSVIKETIRYCENLPKPKLFGVNIPNPKFFGMERPNNAQITAFQLALTVFGKDAVEGFSDKGLTLLTVDGRRMGMQITVDTITTGEGSLDIYPESSEGLAAAEFAANSILAYLNEHRYEDRLYLHFPKFIQWIGSVFQSSRLEDLPPGLDEIPEEEPVVNSPRPQG